MFWTSHNDVNKTLEWLQFEIEQLEKDDWYRWVFIEKESGKLIGTGLIYYDEEVLNFEIGYNLGKKFWGRGYATEAMNEVIRFAREELQLKEIISRHAKPNLASEKVLKKLGFVYKEDCLYECNNGRVKMEGKLSVLSLVK